MKSVHSSTLDVPEVKNIPRHIAVVMDGNGRWAKSKFLPRVAGHKRGVDALRKTVQACVARGVECLTVFAFSSENWRRPADEVSLLMRLFIRVLKHELHSMHAEGIRLKIVGDVSAFEPELQEAIRYAEDLTDSNTAFQLNVAANYGGRWDVLNAVRSMLTANPAFADNPHLVTESNLSPFLALSDCPEPDLFIRTGGEQRISNFLLWQMAYTEFYFTDCLWPDFGPEALDQAILSYQQRERRFGRTSEQLLPEAALGLCPNSSQPKSMGPFPHHS